MVLGKEIVLALDCEKEGGGDGVVKPGLVDVGRNPPKTISNLQIEDYTVEGWGKNWEAQRKNCPNN